MTLFPVFHCHLHMRDMFPNMASKVMMVKNYASNIARKYRGIK
jgi:hypothetical protein